jgi:integrase
MTYGQFVEGRWKAYTVSAKYQPSTTDCYGSLIKNHLLPCFGSMRLMDIRPADISEFLDRLRPKMEAYTLQSFYSMLRLMFDLACEYDLIERSPVRPKLQMPETVRVEKPTLNAASIRRILAAIPDEQERLFTLLIAVTGMRVGEALALRWTDFDVERCEIQVNHTLYRNRLKRPKTDSSRRPFHLIPAVARLLSLHKEQSAFQAGGDFIFCRPDGGPLNPPTLRHRLYSAMDRAGVVRTARKYGYHIFRHTAGTLLYTRTRDLKLVQGRLGHSNISTTSDIYVHLEDKVAREGTEILAEEILANCDLFVTQRSEMVS